MKRVKWLKRIMLFLLSAIVIFTGRPASVLASGEMVDFESWNDGGNFSQKYVEVKKIPTGKTGQKMTVSFVLTNPMSSTDMTNIKLRLVTEKEFKEVFQIEDEEDETDSVSGQKVPEYPFEYTSDIGKEISIDSVKADGSRSVSMSYKVKRNLKEGYYPAVFFLSYGSHERNIKIPIGVNVWISSSTGSTEDDEKDTLDYDFTMGENQATPYAAFNEVMNFGVNLRNSGLKKVYDVRVYMQLNADTTKFPFNINDGNYDRLMGDMESDQTVNVPYSMAVREDVKSGFFPISFKITYREEQGGEFVDPIEKVFYVRVKGEDDDDDLSSDAGINERTKARIIVESFSTDPEEVYAGEVFTLHVRMKNASSSVTASNIMFTFASEEVSSSPVFTTESGSTSLVVNQLAPGSSTDLSIQFKSTPTAEQKSYVMTIKEKYDSPEFKNAEEEVKISIPVKQMPRLNTGTIDVMPDNISVGAETNVMFGINNTGKVLLYNVMAKFVGESIQTTDAYVGNIKPGETGNVDAMVSAVAPTADDGKVKIIISFEDENGNMTEVEKEMLLTVTEAMEEIPGDMEAGNMGEMGGMEGQIPDTSLFARYKVWIIAGALGLAGVVFAIIKKKKKKTAGEEDIEDEIS